MNKKQNAQEIIDELELFLQYAVKPEELPKARELIMDYATNLMALRLLRKYYASLPEAREEAVVKISELQHAQGVYLFVVVSSAHAYLYAVSQEHVVFVDEYGQDISKEILDFFGYGSQDKFKKSCPPVEELDPYMTNADASKCCPACGVEEGEYHLLGCVIEICPWCDSQLHSCNCRFEKLETEEIESEEQLKNLLDLLEEKGRIAYSANESLAYPGTSDGLDN